jgi:uncharacterized membrane protein
MASPQARRPGVRFPTLVVSPRRRNRRLDWLLLRWQARLDARWADRIVPWVLAFGIFVVYVGIALARVDRLEAGPTLARHVQAAWQLATGNPPEVTVGMDGNLFADRLPVLFVPLAALTRFLPAATTLLVAQAAALAIGVVPLWALARSVVRLRVGAAAALVVVYAAHPAMADLDLGDFHPQTMAVTPLLFAAFYAERRQFGRFGLMAAIAVLWSAELGLVVATYGFVLLAEGERRVGLRAAVLGLVWTIGSLLVVQAPLGSTGLVAPGAFERYGDSALEVLIEMLRNPFRPIADMLQRPDVAVVAWVLAPLAFLPLLATRKLVPALPLTALVLIADVPVRGEDGGARMAPLVAFAFVAATFALARLGRPSVERVIVDRRILIVLMAAALAGTATTSPLSPYERPWQLDRPGEDARREALAVIPPVLAVRVPADLVTEVAERTKVEVVDIDERNPAAIVQDVDAVIIDESRYTDLDAAGRLVLRRAIAGEGLLQLYRRDGIVAFVRPEWDR